MKAIILAAGRGSRLGDLTNNIPKCMILINNKTLISYQISAFIDNNISDISVVTGYLKDKIENKFIKKFFVNNEWEETNMVFSLYKADEWLSKHDCIISYGDIIYNKNIIKKLITSEGDICVAYDLNFKKLWHMRFDNPLDDLESFKIDDRNFITEIGNKTKQIDNIMGQFIGVIKITTYGWSLVKEKIPIEQLKKIDFTTMLNMLISKDIKIKGVPFKERWGEVDHPSDIELYKDLL